ncbi:MAG: PPC domain-containing protein [Planctomycetia bacterium]|nr:PPC domain-containing protein [Planctomycetia bacterium]
MLCNRHILTAALIVCASVGSVRAQLPALTLSAIQPPGGQSGTTCDVLLTGVVDGEGVDQLLFSHPGIRAVPAVDPSPIEDGKTIVVPNKFKVTIAADVPPGVYDVRAVGTFGVSNPRAFAVDELKELVEPATNIASAAAMPIEVGSVVNGSVAANGEDWFKFPAKKGQRLLVDILGQRLDSKIDATLVLYDAKLLEVARSRDANRRDPLVDFLVPADGEYFLKVYDFTYGGGADYFYRLAVHTGPYIDFVYPPVVTVGQKNKLTVYGRNLPGGTKAEGMNLAGRPLEKVEVELDVPASEVIDQRAAPSLVRGAEVFIDGREYRLKSSAGRSNGFVLGYAEAPVVLEKEPNDADGKSQAVTIPCEIIGQFMPRGDVDGFTFSAKKDDSVAIEAVSQRLGFKSDPVVVVQQIVKDAEGKITYKDVKEIDDEPKNIGSVAFDARSSDPYFLFKATVDGDYRVILRDLYGDSRGDPLLIYRLIMRKPVSDFRLAVMPVAIGAEKVNVSGVNYKPAGTYVRSGDIAVLTVLAARRDGFAGEITLTAEGLPPDVKFTPAVIGAGLDSAPFSLSVADKAVRWNGTLKIVGRATVDGREIVRAARPVSIIAQGGQAKPAEARLAQQMLYSTGGVEQVPVAIHLGTGAPIVIDRKGKAVEVPIRIERRDGFAEALVINAIGVPASLKVAPLTIPANAKEGKLVVEPTPAAPLGDFSFYVSASTKMNYVRDKAGAEAAMKSKLALDKTSTDLTAAAEAAKKAAAAAPKEKKAAADQAAAAAAAKAKAAADMARVATTDADTKQKAAVAKPLNNVLIVSTQTIVRVNETKEEPKKTAGK